MVTEFQKILRLTNWSFGRVRNLTENHAIFTKSQVASIYVIHLFLCQMFRYSETAGLVNSKLQCDRGLNQEKSQRQVSCGYSIVLIKASTWKFPSQNKFLKVYSSSGSPILVLESRFHNWNSSRQISVRYDGWSKQKMTTREMTDPSLVDLFDAFDDFILVWHVTARQRDSKSKYSSVFRFPIPKFDRINIAVYGVQCTVYSVQCTAYRILYSIQYTISVICLTGVVDTYLELLA